MALAIAAGDLAAVALIATAHSSLGQFWAAPASLFLVATILLILGVVRYPETDIGPDLQILAAEVGSGSMGRMLERLLADLYNAIRVNQIEGWFRPCYNSGLLFTLGAMVVSPIFLFGAGGSQLRP